MRRAHRILPAVGAIVALGALAVAGPVGAAEPPVNVSLYWPSATVQAQQVFVPVGATVKVMLQYGSDGGYDAQVVTPADPAVFATDGPTLYHTRLDPGAAGGYGYALWVFTAVAPGTTTFVVDEVRPWDDSDATTHLLALVARADDVAALDAQACGTGVSIVGVGIGSHVGIRLASNATTGYLWREASVPNTAAFRPDDPEGTYTAPPADAPIGAGGYQTFGYTGVLDGSAPLDLLYARPSETVGDRCAPTVAVGTAADPYPPDDTLAPIAPPPSDEPTAEPTVPPTSTAPDPIGSSAPLVPMIALSMLVAVAVAAVAVAITRRTAGGDA
jgi:predicted secreted protein